MRLYSKALMGGVAAIALGTVTMSGANAMDSSYWTWHLLIDTNIIENININVNIDPVGKVLDEVVQYQIGDVKSEARIHDIYNVKPVEEVQYDVGYSNHKALTIDSDYTKAVNGSGSAHFDAAGHLTTTQTDSATLSGSVQTTARGEDPFFIGGAGVLGGYFVSGGSSGAAGAGVIGAIGAHAHNGSATFDGNLTAETSHTDAFDAALDANANFNYREHGVFNVSYDQTYTDVTTLYLVVPKLQDALKELPKVSANSTSIGNMISIVSDTPVQEDSLQVVFNDVDPSCGGRGGEGGGEVAVLNRNGGDHGCGRVDFDNAQFDLDADLTINRGRNDPQNFNLDSDNYSHDVALLLGLAAGAGLIEQADIRAEADAYDIVNAQVDATATAIGNLKSIDVATGKWDNGLVMADITQLSVANVSADAHTRDITLFNYKNLGGLDIATANATAIGNAVNIKVNSSQGPNIPTP
jgi:hypothetical protein